ncbi:MAG: response regulator [Acidobacteria bacterium]|nr:response regulator [Acidobacteriota bacterium]
MNRSRRTYRKLLVIDDDSRLLASYQDLLVPYGFEVLTAENGKRACSVVEENPDITLVILDIVMPEMDGREWLRWLRSRQVELPVIVITGHSFDPSEAAVRPAAVLEKPFHVAELLDLVGLFCGLSVMSSLRSV